MIYRLLFFTLLFAFESKGQGFLRVDGKQIVNGKGENILLKGIGLGGWMLQEPYMLQLSGAAVAQYDIRQKIESLIGKEKTEQFYEAWLANHCTKADIDSLAAWGFNSVRLPMHFNLYTLPIEQEPEAGKNTWFQKGFTLTDSLLSWCKAASIYLILDLHAAPGGQGNDVAISDRDSSKPSLWQSEANRQKTIALWKKLAERYKDEQWIGGYDLINEPNWGFQKPEDKNGCSETENVLLNKLMIDITSAIRQIDKRHIIFIEGNCWGNNYAGMLPFPDSNVVLSFHKYWNYNDEGSIKSFLEKREKYNMPVWMGESGENSNTWFTQAIELLEKNNIGWAWWPLKKLSFNNPLQVKVNKEYKQIINYWNGKAPKPSPEFAYRALMQLTEDLKTEKNIFQKDVVNSMITQVTTPKTSPFLQNKIKEKKLLFAVDYDLGKNGHAYFDTDTANYRVATGKNIMWNKGRLYRNDGVDIDSCTDIISNGYCVSWTEPGEWLQYTINVEKEGNYAINLRAAASDSAGRVTLVLNDAPKSKIVSIQKSGNRNTWTTNKISNIYLNKGINLIRINVLNGGIKLNYISFARL